MYSTKILTANEFSKFEDIYEDFRTKAASDYNFELEVRNQKTEIRRQKSEIRRQKTEDRS